MKWYYESGGGNWWDGLRWRDCPKTHYLVSEDLLHRLDFSSKHDAMKMLEDMNKGLVCTYAEKAHLNWYVTPIGKHWVIRCYVCKGNATQRAEIEHGITDKYDGFGSVKSWLELMKQEHEEREKTSCLRRKNV